MCSVTNQEDKMALASEIESKQQRKLLEEMRDESPLHGEKALEAFDVGDADKVAKCVTAHILAILQGK